MPNSAPDGPFIFPSRFQPGTSITNIFLLGLYAPAAEVGYYNGAQRIIAAIRALVAPAGSAVYPHTSRKAAKSEDEVLIFVKKYQWIFVGPFLLGGILLILIAPWGMPLFLGARYTHSVPVLQILALTTGTLLDAPGLLDVLYAGLRI